MSTLDRIVNVTVTRQTRAPSQRGFGTPLIIAYHTAWADFVREYSDETEMLDDGFTEDDYTYKMAQAVKAQDPSPETFKIGRRATAFTQIVHLIPRNLTAGFVHSITFDGVEFTYEVQPGDTVELVVDGLVAAMAATVDASVTDATTHAVVTGDTPGVVHSFVAKPGLDLFDATADPGLAADLTAIEGEDADWYGALLDSNSKAQIQAFYPFIETRIALGLVQSADWDVKDAGESTDIASIMENAAVTRTPGIYHREIGTPAAAAWMAKELPKNPGQSTWAFKTLALIPANKLSTGEQTAIEGKNWSWYSTVGGQNITYESKTPAGEFIDIIHAIDFSTARIKEAVFGLFTGNDKVPQTDAGIEMVRAAILGVLKLCSGADFPIFDPETIVVTTPKIVDVPSADRANRRLTNVKYQARLQGAIHGVTVKGNVYV